MKWLVVLGILIFVLVKLRSTLVRHPVFGSVFRILLGSDSKPITVREWWKGAVLLSAFAAAGFICHFGLARAAETTSWDFLKSPYVESFGATTLWVGGLAAIGAVFSLLAALVQSVRGKGPEVKREEE